MYITHNNQTYANVRVYSTSGSARFTGDSLSGVTALTGPVGVFADNGFAVINADKIARTVVEKGTKCLDEISDFFGSGILNEDRTLNRKALAKIVFTDKCKLDSLNTIIYPYITGEILRQIKSHSLSASAAPGIS